ncbi:type I restriction enzyme, S subunit [[Eubacterium] yurii]|nr:type I restriction enzyme, S subunit [[Eubacterium] yurii]
MRYRLEEIVDVTMGQSPKSEYYNTEKDGYPFLQGNRTFGFKYPTFDTYTTVVTKFAKVGDVIMSVRAPVGALNITPVDMCLGRGVCSLRMKNGNQSFLFYMMKYYVSHLLKKESGTVFGSVNRNDINGLEVDIPEDVEEQKRIARYLEMIDDKIELNNAINNNLEQQAQAIFDNMFPNTSSGDKFIGDFITPKRGKNLLSKNAILGDVPVVAGGLEPSTYHNVSNTQAPVLAISASGANAGYVSLWNTPIWSSDSSYIDSSMTNDVYFWYVLLKKRQTEIFDTQTGSAQPHIYPQHIATMPITNISNDDISTFTNTVTPIFERIGHNKAENIRLSALRDTLLRKLMSGELDVSDIDL